MSVEIEGFEEMADQLDRLGERAESGERTNVVSFDELFPEDFMRTYTDYESIEAFFAASPWTVETEADFKQIPEVELDEYVAEHTGFNSWEAMLSVAAREWLNQQLSA
jgi:hypothetical protein